MFSSMLIHEIFLSLVILSAIFNVGGLGFSMYYCLKNNKDLLLLLLLVSLTHTSSLLSQMSL